MTQLENFQFTGDNCIDPKSTQFEDFRSFVYRTNKSCKEIEMNNYLAVQKEFDSIHFAADDISRNSDDSSVFLPRIINSKSSSNSGKYKDIKSKYRSISSNSMTAKAKMQRIGGV